MKPSNLLDRLTIAIPFFAFASTARAHHGEDFLVAMDSTVPEPMHATAFSAIEWSRRGTEDEVSFEPGFMAGLLPGLAAGASFQFEDEDAAGWDYSAIDPSLQWTIPSGDCPVKFAIHAGYVFAEHSGEGHHHDEADEAGHERQPRHEGEDHDEDAFFDDHASHEHNGIHRHGEDHFHMRLIADTKLGEKNRLVLNLIGVAPGSGEYDFGYAIGLRHQFSHAWAVGLENIGDFNTHGENELIAGLYWTPIHECTIRLGAGVGIGQASDDFSLRSGIIWRF